MSESGNGRNRKNKAEISDKKKLFPYTGNSFFTFYNIRPEILVYHKKRAF